ncbi:cellulase family glycosylhydrolase [Saccharicrinis sp. FJH54]|uniref:cellulase family glycosylhydrolase n=1 Tax=Saccharicrinis sp. FJH54 TaxID=3344665 RepID=UPI0035D410C6
MAKFKYLLFPLVILICIFQESSAAKSVNGFLKRDGQRIVNSKSDNFILRGVGPGGWMLQEGYMFQTPVGPQHKIRAMLENLTDKATTDAFYREWLKNFFTGEDVKNISDWGFNSIRVPMHYNLFTLPVEQEPVKGRNTWLSTGFNMLDSLLFWCEKNDIYLILDLHAAPGGQGKDANISDYDPEKPSLWESEANKAKTVALWYQLAKRYSKRVHIGGYDLINEPNWAFENDGTHPNGCDCTINKPILDLYKRITDTIRLVDPNHIIFVEGNCWANNYKGLHELASYDENIVFSFHKYWSVNDDKSIEGVLDLRTQLNVPLWLGETGENSNVWFTDMVEQMERLNIGWATWAYKQMDIDDPYTIVSKSWDAIINYNPETGENRPGREQAVTAMNDLLENIKTENCKFNSDVVFAYLDAPFNHQRKPFKTHNIPGTIFAVDYDFGTLNDAWNDSDYQDLHVTTGKYTGWNSGYTYRSDGVDIGICNDPISNGYYVGWTEDGEWTKYSISTVTPGIYNIILRVSGDSGKIKITLGDQQLEVAPPKKNLQKSGEGWYNLSISDVLIKEGIKDVKLTFTKGGLNVNYIKFKHLSSEVSQTEN